jgi:hypothetical protein
MVNPVAADVGGRVRDPLEAELEAPGEGKGTEPFAEDDALGRMDEATDPLTEDNWPETGAPGARACETVETRMVVIFLRTTVTNASKDPVTVLVNNETKVEFSVVAKVVSVRVSVAVEPLSELELFEAGD